MKITLKKALFYRKWELTNLLFYLTITIVLNSCGPHEPIELREIKDVVADASNDPMLRAQAVFYNPNKLRGKLKHIKVDVYINEKKAATIDQDYRMAIPAKEEFSVPLEVKLAIEELGFFNTLLGVIGGKTFQVRYVGKLNLSYLGIPVRVPVDHKSEIKIKF